MKKIEIPDDVKHFLVWQFSEEIDRELIDQEELYRLQAATFGWLISIDRYDIHEYAPEAQETILRLFFDDELLDALVRDYIDEHGYSALVQDFEDELGTYEALLRYLQLIPAIASQKVKIPKKALVLYRESRGCFVHGHYSASIVVARSIVESCLKELLDEHDAFERGLKELAENAFARKIINPAAYGKALKIREIANCIVHQTISIATKDEAQDVLDHTKMFLEEAYGSDASPRPFD